MRSQTSAACADTRPSALLKKICPIPPGPTPKPRGGRRGPAPPVLGALQRGRLVGQTRPVGRAAVHAE
eukprot:6172853-Pyramimonas_sp.AAC.1